MRQIGSISILSVAERFADFLRAEGIACSVDSQPEGFRIWVQNDDHVPKAKELLSQFVEDPNHERYRNAAERAYQRFRTDRERQIASQRRIVNVSTTWSGPKADQCPVTFGLLALTCVVSYLTGLDWNRKDISIDHLWFSTDGTLNEIMRGEVWRLITPIFLHGNLTHFLFNMLMMVQLGMLIENRKGTVKFLGMVIVMALISNFAQFWFHPIGHFGGMSGVDYGLFGYAWVKGKMEPESGLAMNQQSVTMMLVWFVVCSLGIVGNIANWAHGGGLLTGVAMGMSHSLLKPFLPRR